MLNLENKVAGESKNPLMVAMVGRIVEMNNHNRVEAVRLPNIYQEKELK